MRILMDWWDSPESDYEEVTDTASIDISLEGAVIKVDNNGFWEYESDEWIDKQIEEGYWTSDTYDAPVYRYADVFENLDELLSQSDLFPEDPGRYTLSGWATLEYDVEGLAKSEAYQEYDPGSDDGYYLETSIEFDDESTEVEYREDRSYFTDLKFTKI